MAEGRITAREFRAEVEGQHGFWFWQDHHDHSRSWWFLALMEWAEKKFNEAYEKEKEKESDG